MEKLTRYRNPSEASTMAFIRSVGVVGVVSNTFKQYIYISWISVTCIMHNP